MSGHAGMPGVGGSLGTCVICGDSFALQVLTGQSVQSLSLGWIEQTCYGHDKCISILQETIKTNPDDWAKQFPPESPIHKTYVEALELAGTRKLPEPPQ